MRCERQPCSVVVASGGRRRWSVASTPARTPGPLLRRHGADLRRTDRSHVVGPGSGVSGEVRGLPAKEVRPPMTPGSVHPFRPSADRARCADCSLGADAHDVATLLEKSIARERAAGRLGPRRRGRPPGPQPESRDDRIRLGLPVCQESGCHRAPGRGRGKPRPHCPLHAYVLHRARRPKSLGPSVPRLLLFPLALDAAAQRAAYAESLSLAEWVRRAIGEALERATTPANVALERMMTGREPTAADVEAVESASRSR